MQQKAPQHERNKERNQETQEILEKRDGQERTKEKEGRGSSGSGLKHLYNNNEIKNWLGTNAEKRMKARK